MERPTQTADETRRLLDEARALNHARSYPELYRLLSARPADELSREPELVFLLADVARRVGETATAQRALEQLAGLTARRGNDRLCRNRLNLEGILAFDRGDYPAAERAWLNLLSIASDSADEEFVARANNNLGILCTLNGRSEEALTYYGRAVTAYQRLGHRRGLAQSHQNLAITYREMGYFDEAEKHFRDAAAFARADGSRDEEARVDQERALLILLQDDARLARVTAERALNTYRALSDPVGQAESLRVLGLIGLATGSGDAQSRLNEALALARANHAALLEAECLEALAALALTRNGTAEAERLRAEATTSFERLRAAGWGRQARARVEQILALRARRRS